MLVASIPLVLVTAIFLLTIPYQAIEGSLQVNQVLAPENDTLPKNGSDDKTQIMIDELRKSRTLLEISAPRQVVLSIV
jgi:hypothetical protein